MYQSLHISSHKRRYRIKNALIFALCFLAACFTQWNYLSSLSEFQKFSSDAPIQENSNNNFRRTLHMIQSVFGNDPAFVDQWEASLKSVLFNAPVDSDLHVHVFCNGSGSAAIKEKLVDVLPGTKWRNQIRITVTNVDSHSKDLLVYLKCVLIGPENDNGGSWMDRRLGIGAFFRLFAYKFIQEYAVVANYNTGHSLTTTGNKIQQNYTKIYQRKDPVWAVYLDVDVVILSNLNDLITRMDETINAYQRIENKTIPVKNPLWVYGQDNTGFLGINLLEFDTFWELVEQCNAVKLNKWSKKNDQWLVTLVRKCFPGIWAELPYPSSWSVHIGHGYRSRPQGLSHHAGMVHLQLPEKNSWFDYEFHKTGMDNSDYNAGYVGYFCRRARSCNHHKGNHMMKVRNTWGLADYYLRISWKWLIYQSGTSRIKPGEEGKDIVLVFRNANEDGARFICHNITKKASPDDQALLHDG